MVANKPLSRVIAIFLVFLRPVVCLTIVAAPFSFVRPVAAAGPLCYVDDSAGGTNNGTSWANAFPKLQTAIANGGCTQIWVACGTYYPDEGSGQTDNDRNSTFSLKNNLAIYSGFAGTEALLSQRNVTVNVTILSGDLQQNDVPSGGIYSIIGLNSYHVVTGASSGAGINSTAVLDGFTIQSGGAVGVSGLTMYGGGVINDDGSPTLRNLTIYSNYATGLGGGMFNTDASPSLTSVIFVRNNTGGNGGGMGNVLASSPSLTDVDFDTNTAVIHGGAMYNSGDSSPTIAGGVIENNISSTTVSATDGNGGGIYNTDSSPQLDRVTIQNNTGDHGAGMYNDTTSNPELNEVVFNGNTAHNNGGGMYNASSAPELTDVTFSDNEATSGDGGGIFNDNSDPLLTDVTIDNNTAIDSGGGIFNNTGGLILTNVIISNNTAGYGGGMYNSSGNPSLSKVTISNNTADFHGGGIYNDSGDPTLIGVTISNNTADQLGGGIYNDWGEPVLTNVTLSGNSADDGGALYAIGFGSTLTNVTVSNNTAVRGGAIYFASVQMIILFNTIIADNTPPQCDGTLMSITHSHNLVEDTNCGLTNGDAGGNIVGFDPNLGPLADNGGSTQTHALLLGSLAIDAGEDTYCPAVDQRGMARPFGVSCDIGAFEYAYFYLYLPLILR